MEDGSSIMSTLKRQLFRTHRPFSATVMDVAGNPVLHVSRPFYLLNSQITVQDPVTGDINGEVHQVERVIKKKKKKKKSTHKTPLQSWHLWRRRYDLFVQQKQFARVDGGFLAMEFEACDEDGIPLARVEKNWTGFGRELFTDANRMMQACRRLPPAPAVIQHAWDLFLPTVPEAMRAPLRTFAARYPLNPEFLFNTFALVRPPENTRIRDALVVLRDHSHAFLARMRVRPHTVVRNAPPCISSANTIIPVPLTPTDDPDTFTFPLPAELYHIASTAAINDLDDMRTTAHCRAFWPTALRYAPPHAIVLHASTGRVAVPPEVVQTILDDVRALIAALPAN